MRLSPSKTCNGEKKHFYLKRYVAVTLGEWNFSSIERKNEKHQERISILNGK